MKFKRMTASAAAVMVTAAAFTGCSADTVEAATFTGRITEIDGSRITIALVEEKEWEMPDDMVFPGGGMPEGETETTGSGASEIVASTVSFSAALAADTVDGQGRPEDFRGGVEERPDGQGRPENDSPDGEAVPEFSDRGAFSDGLPEGMELPEDMELPEGALDQPFPLDGTMKRVIFEETGETESVTLTENTAILSQQGEELDASDLEIGWVITVTASGKEAETITVEQRGSGGFPRENGAAPGWEPDSDRE